VFNGDSMVSVEIVNVEPRDRRNRSSSRGRSHSLAALYALDAE
jgi:hypothetical protein